MTITTMDNVVAALNGGQRKDFFKVSQSSSAAGAYHSLWKVGIMPEAGATPASGGGAVPTSSTTGAFSFTTANTSYVMMASLSGTVAGKVIFYDRIWHNSGLSGTVTTTTTIGTTGSVALTRPDANGSNTELWWETNTAIGTTAATLSVVYTNSAGTTGQTATYVKASGAASTTVGKIQQMSLASGDTGVRSVQTYSWNTTTGTAGDFGLVILRRLFEVPINQIYGGYNLDFAALGMPALDDGACISMMVLCSATTTGDIHGSFVIGQG